MDRESNPASVRSRLNRGSVQIKKTSTAHRSIADDPASDFKQTTSCQRDNTSRRCLLQCGDLAV